MHRLQMLPIEKVLEYIFIDLLLTFIWVHFYTCLSKFTFYYSFHPLLWPIGTVSEVMVSVSEAKHGLSVWRDAPH